MTSTEGTCHGCGRKLGAQAPAATRPPVEQCRLRRWDGYVKSTFYALTPAGTVVAESRPFRRRGAAPNERTKEAQRAYDDLVAALRSSGWEHAAQASSVWFDSYFRRGAPVAAPQPPPQRVHVVTESPPAESAPSDEPLPQPVEPPAAAPPDVAPQPESRVVEAQETNGGGPEQPEQVEGQGRTRTMTLLRDTEPEERLPAPPPHQRPRQDPGGRHEIRRTASPGETVVPASDPFTRLWSNADDSHGNHLEAVARLREGKRLTAPPEPTSAEPPVEKHGRSWWRPGAREK